MVVYDTITIPAGVNDTEAAKSHIRELSGAVHAMTVQNARVVGNEGGRTLIELLYEMREEISRS